MIIITVYFNRLVFARHAIILSRLSALHFIILTVQFECVYYCQSFVGLPSYTTSNLWNLKLYKILMRNFVVFWPPNGVDAFLVGVVAYG